MRATSNPSEALAQVIEQLTPHCGAEEVTLPGASFDHLVSTLNNIRKQMFSLEREVGSLRLLEANRQGRAAVEQLATDQFVGLVADPEGKVLRPDFKGGRS